MQQVFSSVVYNGSIIQGNPWSLQHVYIPLVGSQYFVISQSGVTSLRLLFLATKNCLLDSGVGHTVIVQRLRVGNQGLYLEQTYLYSG